MNDFLMPEKMKRATVYGPGDIRIEYIPMRPLGEDECLVKVSYVGICATDLAIYTGDCSFVKSGEITYPCRIGHEWSGIVCKVGSSVKNIKAGDRVVSDSGVACGKCDACLEEDYDNCSDIRSVGTIKCWDGCFAEYMYMPERHTRKVSDGTDLRDAALIEPMSIALAGIKKFNITPESTVAVIGAGPIGLCAAILAKHYGAGKVIVIGRRRSKLKTAGECGADIAVSTLDGDAEKKILEATGGKGVDFTVETSGGANSAMQAIRITKKRGTIALLAFYEKLIHDFDLDLFVGKEQTMRGIMGEFGLVPEACRVMAEGISLEKLITDEISLEDVPAFFAASDENSGSRIKAIVKLDG